MLDAQIFRQLLTHKQLLLSQVVPQFCFLKGQCRQLRAQVTIFCRSKARAIGMLGGLATFQMRGNMGEVSFLRP